MGQRLDARDPTIAANRPYAHAAWGGARLSQEEVGANEESKSKDRNSSDSASPKQEERKSLSFSSSIKKHLGLPSFFGSGTKKSDSRQVIRASSGLGVAGMGMAMSMGRGGHIGSSQEDVDHVVKQTPELVLLALRTLGNVTDRQSCQLQVSLSPSLSLGLKGIFLYTLGILFHVECCIRQLLCSSIIICNITSILHNHHTNIYCQTHIYTSLLQLVKKSVLPYLVSSDPGVRREATITCAKMVSTLQQQVRTGRGKSESSLRVKSIFLYTSGVLFHVEWCIRQLLYSSIILYSITTAANKHHTDIYPILNI